MKLLELIPQFIRYETRPPEPESGRDPNDRIHYLIHVESLAGAQGIQFLCPVCFIKNSGPIGTHAIEVSFADKGVVDDEGSHNREGKPSRWNASGSHYNDLSTQPSILIDPALPACAGWHGYITNGEVT